MTKKIIIKTVYLLKQEKRMLTAYYRKILLNLVSKTQKRGVLFLAKNNYRRIFNGDAELRRHWLTPTMKYKLILCK